MWFRNELSSLAEVSLYFGTTLKNQNSIHEEIKSKLNSGNACYHSVQNILSSSLVSRSINIKIDGSAFLPLVVYGCKTWSLTLRDELRLRVSENRVLRRIFAGKIFRPRRDEGTEEWGRLHIEELYHLYSSPNVIRLFKSRRWDGQGVWHVWGTGQVGTGFWWRDLWERDHTEEPGVDGKIIVKRIFKKWGGVAGTGLNWLRIGTGGMLLCMWW